MPPLLPSDTLLQKTSSITKALRARDAPLVSLLATARDLYTSTSTNVFFPRRNEWLLEWLAQRLKEDEGAAGCQARTSRDCWVFLLELLQAVEPAIVAGTLKRHGIVPLVAKMMEEVRNMEEELSAGSPASSATEAGGNVAGLLDGMAAVLAHLRQVSQTESSIAASMKSTPEVCAGILGAFLVVCQKLLARGAQVDRTWVEAVVDLWKGSIWGSANSKKASAIWSEKCIDAAATLLVVPNTDDSLKAIIENMLTEYVFSPEIIFPAVPGQKQSAVKASTKELIPLLAPLKDEDTAMSGTSEPVNIPYLPLLFRIAIRSQTKKRSKADASVVEVLFTALLSVIPSLDLSSDVPDVSATSGDIIATLLQVLIETGTALSSATLSRIVTKSANLTSTDPDQVRWSLIETVLAIDFDTFLHPSVAALTSELFSALSSAKPSEQVSRVLGLVVDGFVKARDVMGFVERWTAQLKSGTEGDVWRSDALARVFAGIVEDSLTSPQVVKTVNNLREEKQWIILDAVLRGLRREETETQLLTTGALEAVVKVARKDEGEWRAWRLLVRIGDIKPELLLPAIKNAVRLAKADEHWKETVFASEVLMQISEDSGDASALESTQAVLELASNSLSKHQSWDGKISSVDGSNFGLAVAMAVVGGHLEVLEKVEGSCRNKFIDSLLHAALATSPSEDNVNARHICQALVGRSEFYEHPAVKDTMLSALTSNMAPFFAATEDMRTAITGPPKTTIENVSKYEFIGSCLQQYPLEAMRRIAREKILDTCLLLDVTGCSVARPLMYKLWKSGNAGSFMATNPQAIKTWFAVPGVANILRRLLGHAFINRDQEKTKEYLSGLLQMNYSVVKGAKKSEGLTAGDLEMTWVVITEFWKFRNDQGINNGNLEKMRKRFLEQLIKSLDTRKNLDAEVLKYWRDVWELERDDRAAASSLATKVAGKIASGWIKGEVNPDRVVESLGVVCSVAEDSNDVVNATAFAVVAVESLNGERESDILRHYTSMIERLDIATHREVTLRLVDSCFSEEVGDNIWKLFKILIKAIKRPDTPEELSLSTDAFSSVHSRLIISLPSSPSAVALRLNADCINILLREKPWTIIQHNLDTTISALTLCASALGPQLSSENTDVLYTSLTQVLSSILALHRHRVRGRYHLVVSLLQHLITLLFTPKLSRRKTERALHPSWLLIPNPPLSLHAARAYSRVLQTFCDPPVSSVRSHRSELTDSERSKEKKMVSAVVGPVLECFVKRVLEERMEGEVRRELTPGIEKVLEVLGREGVRRVTGRMGGEGRAVVKGLWIEFGRGRGERV